MTRDASKSGSAGLREVSARLRQYAGIAAGSLAPGGRAFTGPLHAQVGICDPCNHRCVMCWDHPPEERASEDTAERFGFRPEEVMPLERFQSVVEDLHRLGTRRIDLVGRGEPLLNPHAAEMVSYAKARSMLVVLCTNASKLSEPLARAFVEARLDRLNVSLNAGTAETYPHIHATESPANYRKVKDNLRRLAEIRREANHALPHIRLSFVISAKNYFEIDRMVEAVTEVGADEAMFTHAVVHEGTPDLALSPSQYQELLSLVARSRSIAKERKVETNLATFAATAPAYLEDEVEGSPVVPCYVGWYFTNVLANGSVLPCCQCSKPVDRISEEKSFAEIWDSDDYVQFRRASRSLPAKNDRLDGCECHRCMLRPRNITIHNLLHPLQRIAGGDDEQLFKIADLWRMKKVDRT